MIRPVTCLCMVMSSVVGLYLYQVKHQAHLLDRQIEHTMEEAKTASERTRMLSAEWTLLNEPGRLQGLAEHYLRLESMKPAQFVQLSSLGDRLPALVTAHPAEEQTADTTDEDGGDATSGPASAPAAILPTTASTPAAPDLPLLAIVHAKHVVPTGVATHRVTVASTVVVHRLSEADAQRAHPVAAQVLTVRQDVHRLQLPPTKTAMLPKASIIAKPLPLAVPRHPAHGMLNTMNAPVQSPAPSYVMHTSPMVAPMHEMQTASFSRSSYGSSLGMASGALPPPVPVSTMR